MRGSQIYLTSEDVGNEIMKELE
jgi:hypothetical protein